MIILLTILLLLASSIFIILYLNNLTDKQKKEGINSVGTTKTVEALEDMKVEVLKEQVLLTT